MHLKEFEQIKDKINKQYLMGSDSSLANLYFLKDVLNILCYEKNGILFREYDFSSTIKGFAFPILVNKEEKNVTLDKLFDKFLKEVQKNNSNEVSFCYFTEEQKNLFDEYLKSKNLKVEWNTNRDDSDYLYLQSDLADLPGSEYQKKRNHVSKFIKKHEGKYNFVYFDCSSVTPQIKDDFVKVAKKWLCEFSGNIDNTVVNESKSMEFAVNHLDSFDFFGGILYVEENPKAITLASKISDEVIDIHFEKCLSDVAKGGGYAMINNLFAKECKNFKYINREEDLGIEGLRKAKLSYKPEIILDKFYGTLVL